MSLYKRLTFLSSIFRDESSDDLSADLIRLLKFKKIIASSLLCMALILPYLMFVGNIGSVFVLLFLMLFSALSYFVAKHKEVRFGSSMFLIMVTSCCCLLMWRDAGIFDEAILAFPGILIFAVVIANFKLARWLMLFMAINILALGLVNDLGLYINKRSTTSIGSAFLIISILLVVTYSIYLTTKDSGILLKKLNRENRKVRESRNEIMRLQNHDPLTGLPNRVLAEEIFEQRLRLGEREGFSVSLMFIDLDGFKSVNDSLGHVAGDHFLKTIAQRFSKTIRDTDIVCRFAGDEFVVIAVHENEQANQGYSALAEKLLFALSKPVKLSESYISLTASIGIAVAPAQGQSFEELNQKADIAMYSIKESGRNSYRYYHQDMSKDNVRQLTLAQGLRKACDSGQLSLHFQSKQRLKDNKVFGAEALLRWVHPELGVVSPVEFIPIAESCGAIIEIGEWVLVEAVKACAQWHKLGFTNMSVAVNVSALQLVRGNFHSKIQVTLKKYKLPAKFLVLELTESLLFDLDGEHKKSIESLRALGIRLAIDDFGTGYSNLRYLQEHDIQMLKIDRSFVSKMLSSKQDLAIVETIANMSKTLGMDIVAEGIEDNETKVALMNLGCLLGQGYLWNKPLHHDAFIAYLQAQMTSGA